MTLITAIILSSVYFISNFITIGVANKVIKKIDKDKTSLKTIKKNKVVPLSLL